MPIEENAMIDEATAVKTTDKQIVPMRCLEAPIVYVDGSTNMGCNNQVVSLTLVTAVYLPQSNVRSLPNGWFRPICE
jgi:hypothetical protein